MKNKLIITNEQFERVTELLKKEKALVTEIVNCKHQMQENVDWSHNVVDSLKSYLKNDIVSSSTLLALVNSGYITLSQLKKSGVSQDKIDELTDFLIKK